jgi:hypothetical protein
MRNLASYENLKFFQNKNSPISSEEWLNFFLSKDAGPPRPEKEICQILGRHIFNLLSSLIGEQ